MHLITSALVPILTMPPSRAIAESPLRTSHNLLRSSRESLRSIPCPKPMPSISIPSIPSTPPFLITRDHAPQLPPITTSPPIRISSLEGPPRSAPAATRIDPPPPRTYTRPISTAPSTSSTWYRSFSRSDALARLEGRALPSKNKYIQRNFMSMSDDEEDAYGYDDEDEDEDVGEVEGEVEGDECSALDLDVPQSACGISDVVRLSQLKSTMDDGMFFGSTLLRHRSDLRNTLPASKPPSTRALPKLSSSKKSRSTKTRSLTTESWFPLASFTDDESTWNWRSFIEIASVT
jgi:hypothetical protein